MSGGKGARGSSTRAQNDSNVTEQEEVDDDEEEKIEEEEKEEEEEEVGRVGDVLGAADVEVAMAVM